MAGAAPLGKARAGRFDHLAPEVVGRARIRTARHLPRQADAMTIGRTIYVRPGHEASDALLAHELVHVRQWQQYGPIGFLRRYLSDYLRFRVRGLPHWAAYRRIGFECEAEWEARSAGPR